MGAREPAWTSDPTGHNGGWGEIPHRARDTAGFGQLYLDGGRFDGRRIVAAGWLGQSLQPYTLGINSDGAAGRAAGLYFRDLGHGRQGWRAPADVHRVDFAWGHGGPPIVLLPELDLVIVTTADPLYPLPEQKGWSQEVRILDLVGRFINGLPGGEQAMTE